MRKVVAYKANMDIVKSFNLSDPDEGRELAELLSKKEDVALAQVYDDKGRVVFACTGRGTINAFEDKRRWELCNELDEVLSKVDRLSTEFARNNDREFCDNLNEVTRELRYLLAKQNEITGELEEGDDYWLKWKREQQQDREDAYQGGF